MERYRFKKIDAFATQNSDGNPAGMVKLDAGQEISPKDMLTIAREMKGFVSEVGFVTQLDEASFDLKYYSAEREVDFCGHATIAILFDLIKNSETLISRKQIDIRTKKGVLVVQNKIESENAVFISAPLPTFSANRIETESLAKALRCQEDAINGNYPISVINAGLETLIVPINSLGDILDIKPDLDELKVYCENSSVDIIILFTPDVADKNNGYRTRVFAPTFGYLEDPATGSGNSALGCYLLKNRLWQGDFLSLEQNGILKNPNIIKLMAETREDGQFQVIFGGGAIVRIEGEYLLH